MSRVLLGVSVTAGQARALRVAGPRRDFFALAASVRGRLFVQDAQGRSGRLGRWFGAHWRQARRIARHTREGDVVFADSEHLGIPLLGWLVLYRRRPQRVVILAHLPGRWWKRLALALLTRLVGPGTILVHSVEQRRIVAPWLGRRWRMQAIRYQVDTDFWRPVDPPRTAARPLVLAVGSEHRDYETLVRAVQGLPADVVIAAGSHWARRRGRVDATPPNVTYLERTLDFRALREWYQQADIAVVPLHDVPNQFGVTSILEAMSSALPVVATASRGQRECVVGPLMRSDGTLDGLATADRGPHLLAGGRPSEREACGLYVAPGDADALRHALLRLLEDADLRRRLGAAGRAAACESFPFERFVGELASALRPEASRATAVAAEATR